MKLFLSCVDVVIPMFIVMSVGYITKRIGLFSKDFDAQLNRVVFYVFVPIMVFSSIYDSDLDSSFQPDLIALSVILVVAGFFLSIIYTKALFRKKSDYGVLIQGEFRTNILTIGTAVLTALLPNENFGIYAIILAFQVPLMNILGVLSLELFGDCRASFRKLLLGIATNPLILGSVVGVVFIVCGIKLPESVEVSVSNISKTSSTLLLFLLGASIEFGSLARYCRELVLVSVMRLLLLPAICLYITYKLGYTGIEFASILAVIATPNAANSYNMAVQMGGDGELASSIIVITTVASLFTIVGWTYVFRTLGLF